MAIDKLDHRRLVDKIKAENGYELAEKCSSHEYIDRIGRTISEELWSILSESVEYSILCHSAIEEIVYDEWLIFCRWIGMKDKIFCVAISLEKEIIYRKFFKNETEALRYYEELCFYNEQKMLMYRVNTERLA